MRQTIALAREDLDWLIAPEADRPLKKAGYAWCRGTASGGRVSEALDWKAPDGPGFLSCVYALVATMCQESKSPKTVPMALTSDSACAAIVTYTTGSWSEKQFKH
ncbi:hypothetical protein GCM10011319_42010 [Mameliella alba]|nr:hypothetical protein GCM10011319_42010 [Mameliella alba]